MKFLWFHPWMKQNNIEDNYHKLYQTEVGIHYLVKCVYIGLNYLKEEVSLSLEKERI